MKILKQFHQRLSRLAWCDINTFKLRILRTLISLRDQYVLEISRLSCSENLETHFSLQVAKQGGLSSVHIFQYLFYSFCVRVLYFVAVYFYFFSTLMTRLFFLFLLFGFLFSFSVVRSIFCGAFNAETLTSSNGELLLSGVSE